MRLKLLFHHGYLFRDEQPTKLTEGRRPLVYVLDQKEGKAAPTLGKEKALAFDSN